MIWYMHKNITVTLCMLLNIPMQLPLNRNLLSMHAHIIVFQKYAVHNCQQLARYCECVSVSVCVSIHVSMSVCVCIMDICTQTQKFTNHMNTCTHTYAHAHTHAHMHKMNVCVCTYVQTHTLMHRQSKHQLHQYQRTGLYKI